ncbi:MAG: alpha/beta hydrolase, partial [Actinomycetota bacterium]
PPPGPMTEQLRLHTEDGLSLEAELDGARSAERVLVFCHPHPKMGGTMNAPLLLTVRDPLVENGWAVLRFNFRGIGDSEGEAGIGHDERRDVRAALAEAARLLPDAALALAGWSFGAAVALRVAGDEEDLRAVVAIAPAVKEKPGVTAGLPPPEETRLGAPTLFIVGANDDLTAPQDCREWAESAGAEFIEMPGANHFFWAKYPQLAAEIEGFLDRHVRV